MKCVCLSVCISICLFVFLFAYLFLNQRFWKTSINYITRRKTKINKKTLANIWDVEKNLNRYSGRDFFYWISNMSIRVRMLWQGSMCNDGEIIIHIKMAHYVFVCFLVLLYLLPLNPRPRLSFLFVPSSPSFCSNSFLIFICSFSSFYVFSFSHFLLLLFFLIPLSLPLPFSLPHLFYFCFLLKFSFSSLLLSSAFSLFLFYLFSFPPHLLIRSFSSFLLPPPLSLFQIFILPFLLFPFLFFFFFSSPPFPCLSLYATSCSFYSSDYLFFMYI